MTKEQEEAIEKLKMRLKPNTYGGSCVLGYNKKYCFGKSDLDAIETVLNMLKEKDKEIKKKDKIIDLIKEYVNQEIIHYTETIRDYIDDDKEGNKDYIGELKEKREHWRDIDKILNNKAKEELYMNWWKYGLYV